MAKYEEISKGFTLDEKLNLLLVSSSKIIQEDSIDIPKSKVLEFLKDTSFLSLYKTNNNKITKELIFNFVTTLYQKAITNNSSVKKNKLSMVKTQNDDMLVSFKNGANVIITENHKKTKSFLMMKLNEETTYKEKLAVSEITKEDFNEYEEENLFMTENLLNKKVEEIIDFIMPLIKAKIKFDKKGKPSAVSKELKKSFIPSSIKIILTLIFAGYYNVLMYVIFSKKSDGSEFYNFILIITIMLNVLFVYLLIHFIPKFNRKNKKNKLVDMLNEFTIVTGEEDKSITRKNTFNSNINFTDVCKNFYNFSLSNGLLVEHKKIRELFSAMASHRLVYINDTSNSSGKLLKVLNDFLGNETYYDTLDNSIDTEDALIWRYENGKLKLSNFVNGVCEANKHTNNINITALLNVNVEKSVNYLGCINNFIKNPNEKGVLKINSNSDEGLNEFINNGRLSIPKNTWFFLFTNDEILTKKNLDSILIELETKEVEASNSMINEDVLSYTNFIDIINRAREESYLSDEGWNKIDSLETELKNKYKFALENQIVRKMETYSSVYNVTGADEVETIDSVLANIVVPNFLSKVSLTDNRDINAILDSSFDENQVITKNAINKYIWRE